MRPKLARFEAPDAVEFPDALPETSPGEIQEYLPADREWGDLESRIK